MKRAGETRRQLHTLRKGLPRFVVFIIWEEVLGPSGGEDMATGTRDRMWKRGGKKEKRKEKVGGGREEDEGRRRH